MNNPKPPVHIVTNFGGDQGTIVLPDLPKLGNPVIGGNHDPILPPPGNQGPGFPGDHGCMPPPCDPVAAVPLPVSSEMALVGLAGVLYMSRVNAGLPNAGIGFEFDAMTAAIIGGTSFSGGIGTAIGTLAGAFIMGFLGNIMNLLGIQSYLQQIIKGGIIVLAVAYDISTKHRKKKSGKAAKPEQARVAAN